MPLFCGFWGLVVWLNLFGAFCCHAFFTGRPRTPRFEVMFGMSVAATLFIIAYLVSQDAFLELNILVFVAAFPSGLFALAFLLRSIRRQRRPAQRRQVR